MSRADRSVPSSSDVRVAPAGVSLFEPLEKRVLLHAGHDHGPGDLSKYLDESGHIPLSLYQTLTTQQQAMFDPHQVADDRPLEEQFAEVGFPPQNGRESIENLNPGEVAVHPDFFPTFSTNPYLSTTSQAGRVLVRFGTRVNNQGLAPATMQGGAVNSDGTQTVHQLMYGYTAATNSLRQIGSREAGRFIYHAAHSHLHFEGYAFYSLHHRNSDGSVGGIVKRADGSDAVGEKVGYCLINIESSFTMQNGQNSRTLPSYNASGQPSTSCGQLQGVSVGRADVYSDSLEGQWLDVTGIPNGKDYIGMTLDADNAIVESNENNNAIFQLFTLNANPPANQIPIDRFDDLASGGPNNSMGTASDLGEMGIEAVAGLTAHAAYDDDYFSFVATSTGPGSISTTTGNGDLDLYLYDKGGTELARRTTAGTGNETINFNFVKGRRYYVLTQVFNEQRSNNYQLNFNIKPTVDTTIASRSVGEASGETRYFRVARNGPASAALTVPLVVSGTATAGVDYELLSSSVLFDVESKEKWVGIRVLNDTLVEGNETIVVTLGSGANFVGGLNSIRLTIADDDVARAAPAPVASSGKSPAATARLDERSPFASTAIRQDVFDADRREELALFA
jgi:hypothetical protein